MGGQLLNQTQESAVSAETSIRVYSQHTATYATVELQPVEHLFLDTIGSRWGTIRMLDLGIGTGRTTYTFAAICAQYVGIDFALEMVRRAQAQFPASDRAEIRVGDARAMPELEAESFDIVLFSFNGIDSIDDVGRRQVPWSNPVKALRFRLGAVKHWARMQYHNRVYDRVAAEARGWGVLREAHGFTLPLYFITPDEAIRQATTAGFTVDRVLTFDATTLQPPYRTAGPWLYYWCLPREHASAHQRNFIR
jgi:SAM-dependent methyltransferase